MASVLKRSTPGVYIEEISTFPPSVAEVETAIPAFIGYTEKADRFAIGDLKLIANKINNFSEFEQFYGGAPIETNNSISVSVKDFGGGSYDVGFSYTVANRSKHILYYCVKHFYDNGGVTCFIVSVDTYAGAAGAIKKTDFTDPNKGLEVVAEIDEVTLLVIPEANRIDDPTTVDITVTPKALPGAYKEIVGKMIAQASTLKDRFALIDPFMVTPKNSSDPNGDIDKDITIIRECTATVTENRYAAAYYPNVVSTYGYRYDFDNLEIDTYTWLGEGTNPFPIANNTKMSAVPGGSGSILYNKVKTDLASHYVLLPPSAAIAGLYTRIDSTKGVWKAPANETIYSIIGPEIAISSREQENLNVDPNSGKSINVIRSFPGYGTLVWGARTLNGNDNEWRYISVRRFFNMVEESIKKSIQWAVFEPNTINTWVKVQAMIENYLFLKWREGALAGVKPEQAFFVRVGLPATMSSTDVLEGRMNVEIGMAVARPAEFIILKFSQLLQQS